LATSKLVKPHTPHPTPHTPHPATTEKLFQQTLNTLREVVNALGGTVEIIVKIPNKEPIIIGDYSETKCN
jgi:hypothetical protein